MKAFWSDFFLGLSCYKQSFGYIRRNGLLKYNLFPALVSLFLFLGLFAALFFGAPELTDLVAALVGYEEFAFRGSGYFAGFLNFLLTVVFGLAMIALYYFTFKFVMLTVLSPYLAFMSEKIEKIETGKEFPFDRGQYLADVGRGLKMNLRNVVREGGLTVIFLLMSLIPVVGIFFTFLVFLVSSYFVGFNMMDYYHERQKFSVKESADQVWSRKGFAMAIGMLFNLMMFVPLLGVLIAPMMAVVASSIGLNKTQLNE